MSASTPGGSMYAAPHLVQVYYKEARDEYRAECSLCGWTGGRHSNPDVAHDQGVAHSTFPDREPVWPLAARK